MMGLVKSNHYAHVDCDAEGCQNWRRLSEPQLFPDALAEIVKAGWLALGTESGLYIYCQGCKITFAAHVMQDNDDRWDKKE